MFKIFKVMTLFLKLSPIVNWTEF